VDRILNCRQGVDADTLQRMFQAVEKLGGPPQPGRPQRDASFRFACVLPAENTPFRELGERQVAQSAGDFRHQHINEVTHRFDASDPQQFAAELAGLGDCDGIALRAPDVPAVKRAINELVGTPRQIYEDPVSSTVAARLRSPRINLLSRGALPGLSAPERSTTRGVRAERLRLLPAGGHAAAQVRRTERLSDLHLVHLALADSAPPEAHFEPGQAVAVEPQQTLWFDADGKRTAA